MGGGIFSRGSFTSGMGTLPTIVWASPFLQRAMSMAIALMVPPLAAETS